MPVSWVGEGDPLGFGLMGMPIVGCGVRGCLLWLGRWRGVVVGGVGRFGVGVAVPLVLMGRLPDGGGQ